MTAVSAAMVLVGMTKVPHCRTERSTPAAHNKRQDPPSPKKE